MSHIHDDIQKLHDDAHKSLHGLFTHSCFLHIKVIGLIVYFNHLHQSTSHFYHECQSASHFHQQHIYITLFPENYPYIHNLLPFTAL